MPGSNWRPLLYEGSALPTELIQRIIVKIIAKVGRLFKLFSTSNLNKVSVYEVPLEFDHDLFDDYLISYQQFA